MLSLREPKGYVPFLHRVFTGYAACVYVCKLCKTMGTVYGWCTQYVWTVCTVCLHAVSDVPPPPPTTIFEDCAPVTTTV